MKKLLIMGVFALLCTTLFSCTADEYETQPKNEVKKNVKPSYADDGPGDGGIKTPPPPPPAPQ